MKRFKLTASVAKKNRFDVFGWFESTKNLTEEEKKILANSTSKEFFEANSDKIGTKDFKVNHYYMTGDKLIIDVESV